MTKINIHEDFKKCRTLNCKELLQLLNAYGPKFWSWGANGFTNINNLALKFKVQGHHHKGHVYISLNGLDLFDVHLTTIQGNIIEKMTDLYNDQLFEALDKKIEWIAEYKD